MDEKIKKIEERVNHNKYSYLYGTFDSNNNADDDIDYLLSKIEELEAELQREEQAHTMSVYDFNIRIAGLGEEIETLKTDALIMALRLLGEDENSFSPETREVMNRWRPKCLKLIKEKP